VPGRAIIDESNTFFYGETNLDGVLDLVSRSKKPVQELAWASIGNVLTAIQICEANDRGVLVPWNSWRHEFYKPVGTLHDADRGGFIFAPEVGPPRERPRTRLLLVVSEYHLHSKRLTGRHPV